MVSRRQHTCGHQPRIALTDSAQVADDKGNLFSGDLGTELAQAPS